MYEEGREKLFKEMTFRSQQLFIRFSLFLFFVPVHQTLLAVISTDVPIYIHITRSLLVHELFVQ